MIKPFPLLAEGGLQERILQAIFRSLIDDHRIRIYSYTNRDSTLAAVEAFLFERPRERHIAVVLETGSDDPGAIQETLEEGSQRLLRTFPSGGRWHIALAVPTLAAWALIDDHVRQEYDKIRHDPNTASTPDERAKIERSNDYNLATKIGDWVAVEPFDLEALRKKSRQVRELCTFIENSLQPKPEPELITAADWF